MATTATTATAATTATMTPNTSFTAGHVSDQRMEQGMAAMKANGKLKSYLSGCTYGEAISRISQVARDQDFTALKELQVCREQHKKVGLRYAEALKNSKVEAMKYSCVEQISPLTTTQFFVKENDASTIHCEVDLNSTVSWRGEQLQIITGTCSYYLSTRMICPCACAAMQRFRKDIDKIDNVHPFYRIWYHPLWKEAIKSLQLHDYKDSPFYSLTQLEPTSISSAQNPDLMSNIKLEDTMRCFNSEIFDKIGNLGNISEAQRINKMREHFYKLEKIAVKSVKSTKYAICSIIELTNRLGSLSVSSTNSNITVSAIDKALHRHQKHSLQNLSPLNYLKRKANTDSKDKTRVAVPSKKKNCRVCRDYFKEPVEIYSTHRANSSKCPHLITVNRKRPPEQKSGDDGMTDKNDKELLVSIPTCVKMKIEKIEGDDGVIEKIEGDDGVVEEAIDKELVVSNQNSIKLKIEKVDNVKVINLSDCIKSEANANGDISDNQSTYTTADTFDPDIDSFELKCKEKLCPGDVIQYYCPIFVSGDPRGLRETSILSVDPNNYFPLVLSNGEGLPSTCKVKRIKVIQHNRLVDNFGIFRSMDRYHMKKRGSATAADGVYMQASFFDESMKRNIKNAMGKAIADGFAPGDMLINKFHGGQGVGASDEVPTNSKKRTSEDYTVDKNCTMSTGNYVFPHKSSAEAIDIMRRYGILHDVPGDGSCGYHCIMLLLRRMKLIDITLSVTQFRRGILEFIQSNMTNFIGVHPDGNDAVFQYTWGDMSRPNKRRCNPAATRTKFITKEVMNGIWSNHVDYSLPVKKAHWMDSAYLFPVIAYKHQIRKLVLYDNSGTDSTSVDSGRCFTTCVYCYDKSKCQVSFNTILGFVHDIDASGNAGMVYFCDQSHFNVIEFAE